MHTHHTDAVQHVHGRGSRLTASGMHAHVPHDTPGVPRVVAAVRAVLTRGGFTRGGTEGDKHACIMLWARADVHRATYRRAIETGFVFADSRGHVRAGQRATRAAGRGRWICERFAKLKHYMYCKAFARKKH